MAASSAVRLILLAVLLLAPGLAGSDPMRRPTPPDERRTVRVQDSTRSYYVHFPAGSRAAPWPLVLLLHPAGSGPKDAMAQLRWIEASDENGFILVGLEARTPSAWLPAAFSLNPRVWNSGDAGVHEENILASDDVAYAEAVLQQLMKTYTLDTSRIYAVGFSSGGGMTQRLALELPGRFAAIASVGALRAQPAPLRKPLSVMLVYGKQDPVTPYDGGTRHSPWGDTPNQPPVADSVAAWVRDLHCAPTAQSQQPDAQVLRESWGGCDDGTEVQVVTIADAGHHWPGGLPDKIKALGPATGSFDATAEIWSFFAAHPRQSPKASAP